MLKTLPVPWFPEYLLTRKKKIKSPDGDGFACGLNVKILERSSSAVNVAYGSGFLSRHPTCAGLLCVLASIKGVRCIVRDDLIMWYISVVVVIISIAIPLRDKYFLAWFASDGAAVHVRNSHDRRRFSAACSHFTMPADWNRPALQSGSSPVCLHAHHCTFPCLLSEAFFRQWLPACCQQEVDHSASLTSIVALMATFFSWMALMSSVPCALVVGSCSWLNVPLCCHENHWLLPT